MKIGIDFDNTLVDYTGVFHRVAVKLGWIPASVPSDKTSVRDTLRRDGHEDRWIKLQGLVYGPHIFSAKPFPGIASLLAHCRQKKIDVYVISHKTRRPFMGDSHDLHDYALQWLEKNDFFAASGGLSKQHIFLELTKEAKLSRIAGLGLEYFIDDLPEFLAEPQFPSEVKRILFDPHGQHEALPLYRRIPSWEAFLRLLP